MHVDGKKILIGENTAVAADVVAMLAGVSFGSVLKVISAINVLHETCGVRLEDIVRGDAFPTQLAGTTRRADTAAVVAWITARPIPAREKRTMRLEQRMDANPSTWQGPPSEPPADTAGGGEPG